MRRRGQVIGDVHPVQVANVAGAFTPVPGGVGPLTIAMLMVNTIQAAEAASRHDMIRAGLTGGMACGKSFVARSFRRTRMSCRARRRSWAAR